jgi:two-component system, NarL family, nitrate/nitrite sensor histidine kinase NarX
MLSVPIFYGWVAFGLVIVLSTTCALLFTRARSAQVRTNSARQRQSDLETRLATVLQLNRDIFQAQDEKSLIHAALSALNSLVGAVGISFVPFDEWGQPLPAVALGDLTQPALTQWTDYLSTAPVRERCQACKELLAFPEGGCPLFNGPHPIHSSSNPASVYCLPMKRGSRSLGMVNLFLPPDKNIQPDQRVFLEGLIEAMAIAIEGVHLQNQEMITLRQLQPLRSSQTDIIPVLQAQFDTMRLALDLDLVYLRVRTLADERLSGLQIQSGSLAVSEVYEPGILQALELGQAVPIPPNSENLTGQILPLNIPEGHTLGILLAIGRYPERFDHPRQISFLQTVASQTALIIETERLNLSLEYKLVIQERNRLAREIHDGLAQTLAFLKMQTAQMQSALNQGDTSRLNRLVSENRQTLADAYIETRQAIDNLRISPEAGLTSWLNQLTRAFEQSTGIQATFVSPAADPPVLPEIQVQLLRIVQEALNNVRKHSGASQVNLALRLWQNELILEITDNGKGFSSEDVPVQAQYGLRGMRERAELIGADFQVISQPNRGVTIRLCLSTVALV